MCMCVLCMCIYEHHKNVRCLWESGEGTRSPGMFPSVMDSEFCCGPDRQQSNKTVAMTSLALGHSLDYLSSHVMETVISCPVLSCFRLVSQSNWEMGVVAGHNKRNQQLKQELSWFVCRASAATNALNQPLPCLLESPHTGHSLEGPGPNALSLLL